MMLSRGTVIDVLYVAHGRLFLREYACVAHIVCVVEIRALPYNKCAGNILLFVVLNPHLPNASCTRDESWTAFSLPAHAIFAQPAQDRTGMPQKNRVFLIAVLFRFGTGFPASFDTKAVGWCGVVDLCPVHLPSRI